MELTAAMFEDLIRNMRSEPRPGRDHRSVPRIGMAATVQAKVQQEPTKRVRIRDISADGMGLLMNQPLAIPSEIAIELLRSGEQPLILRCEACHSHAVGDGFYRIGVKFLGKQSAQAGPD